MEDTKKVRDEGIKKGYDTREGERERERERERAIPCDITFYLRGL